eukprot:TRINITY_DN11130_c0_g1_i1.p1 TRINITY_DN11130_c0_g1~~TRINITY_DN11130_c0_g1_i1.p1  ORF type:complete len:990 (+),score=222.97 TRINITY_DN11130_c0_g1_i1:117-3086(+)
MLGATRGWAQARDGRPPSRPASRSGGPCSARRPCRSSTPRGTPKPCDAHPKTLLGALGLPRCPGALEESRELPATPRLGSEASQELASLSVFDIAVAAAADAPLMEQAGGHLALPASEQGRNDISDMFAWMQPIRRGKWLKGLMSLATEIDEKTQEWNAYLGGRCSRKESLQAVNGDDVPPKDLTRTAEACSLLLRLVRNLPIGFPLRSMLEPLVQEVLEAVFSEWPSLLPSLQDLKESEVSTERLLQLSTYSQLVFGLRASAEESRMLAEAAERKAQTETALASAKKKEAEEVKAKLSKVEEELQQVKDKLKSTEFRATEAEDSLERFKEQTRLTLSDYAEMQHREQTMASDLRAAKRDAQDKDNIIKDLRSSSTELTQRNQRLTESLMSESRLLEERNRQLEQLPKLREKLEYFEAEEAIHGIEFASRVAHEVFSETIEKLCHLDVRVDSKSLAAKSGKNQKQKSGINKSSKLQTKWILDSVISRLRAFSTEMETLKKQVCLLRLQIQDVQQLVPIWNETALQDLMEAYDDDAAVHRQIFSMKDHRNFAGLGTHPSVPMYLRVDGFVRHVYKSKAEIEEFMNEFYAEAPPDLSTEALHAELHAHLQRLYPDPEKMTEFAYAFICSLEAYRDDPDFELFDLMLSGAIHSSIKNDSEQLLRELQVLVRHCNEYQVDDRADKGPQTGGRQPGSTARAAPPKAGLGREQISQRVMRAVLKAVFPEKSIERHNALARALHVTLQMLSDAGKSPSPDMAFISDLFAATADGTQSPLIEELRRQQVHEVLEFTAEIARRFRKEAGGESYVDRGHIDNHFLIKYEGAKACLHELYPSSNDTQISHMLSIAWNAEDESEKLPVCEVLQRLRHSVLLKKERSWVIGSTKEVVDELKKLGEPRKEERQAPVGAALEAGDSQFEDQEIVQPRRNRAVKVLDNPIAKNELYNTPQGLEKEILRSTPKINFMEEQEDDDKAGVIRDGDMALEDQTTDQDSG